MYGCDLADSSVYLDIRNGGDKPLKSCLRVHIKGLVYIWIKGV